MGTVKALSSDKLHLIPLYLGIVGHRDIRDEDRAKLKNLIKDFIWKKKIQCPHTPITFMTPLADGADRIAALAAMESGIDYIAVLPMPVEEYKHDFILPGSTGEFENLLSKASAVIELPVGKGCSIEDIRQNTEKRTEQYYQNGIFIASKCHTLVALWDGTDNGEKGGTADVIRLKKSGIPGKTEDAPNTLRYLQTGTIYHIITPRLTNPSPDNPLSVKIYYPSHFGTDLVKAAKSDEEVFARIDSFNKDVVFKGAAPNEKIDDIVNSMMTDYKDIDHQQTLQSIAYKHSISGELATFFQKRRFRALKVLLSMVVIAFLFLQIYAEFYHEPLVLLLYPITLGIAAIWFLVARKKRYEHKHEDYRALSEAYRIQFYLYACGKHYNVSDHYLRRHRGELEWVVYALRVSYLCDWDSHIGISDTGMNGPMEKFRFLKEKWIDVQLNYFKKSSIGHNHSFEKYEFFANSSFIGAIASAFLLFLVSFFAGKFPESLKPVQELLHSIFTCVTHVFLVLAAALHGYVEKMVYSEQAKNYQQMTRLFQLASHKLSRSIEANNVSEANDIIWELAREALLENGDWLLLHRSRPLEMPKG